MKKPVVVILSILFLAFISIYFIVPQKITTTHVIEVDANDINISKFLVNKKPWHKWWPGQHSTADSTRFAYKGVDYILQKSTNSEMNALIKMENIELNSRLTYATIGEGMSNITWFTEKQSSLNPIERVAEFIKIKRLTKDIDTILTHFKKFMQTDTNVYGMAIKISKIKTPFVLASATNTNEYPSPGVIYSFVSALRKQISAQNALTLDSPMVNVHPIDKNDYRVTIAIPINQEIKPGANMALNKLVRGGNALETTVKGGKGTITNAFVQLKNYQRDHNLTSPAMPYELLITNRLAEKDTAKWVTKIFWPVY